MKTDNKIVRVILKEVTAVYSGLKEAKAYKDGAVPKYNLSILLGGDNLNKVKKAFKEVTKELKEYKVMEFKDEKFKSPSDWAKKAFGDLIEEGDCQLNLSNKFKPNVSDYVNKVQNPDIYGGDKVNVMFDMIYYAEMKVLGFSLKAVSLVEKGEYSQTRSFDVSGDEEWLNVNEIKKEDVKTLEKEAQDKDTFKGLELSNKEDTNTVEEIPF